MELLNVLFIRTAVAQFARELWAKLEMFVENRTGYLILILCAVLTVLELSELKANLTKQQPNHQQFQHPKHQQQQSVEDGKLIKLYVIIDTEPIIVVD